MTVKTLLIEYDDAHGDVMGCYPLRAPAVEVVRCRDCAEWYEYDAYERTWPEVTEFKLHECRRFKTRDPEGYCAWGERRDG